VVVVLGNILATQVLRVDHQHLAQLHQQAADVAPVITTVIQNLAVQVAAAVALLSMHTERVVVAELRVVVEILVVLQASTRAAHPLHLASQDREIQGGLDIMSQAVLVAQVVQELVVQSVAVQ
jgi:hypothetical protein